MAVAAVASWWQRADDRLRAVEELAEVALLRSRDRNRRHQRRTREAGRLLQGRAAGASRRVELEATGRVLLLLGLLLRRAASLGGRHCAFGSATCLRDAMG